MAVRRSNTRPAPRRGLTLIESTLSVVIVAVMLVAALRTLGSTARANDIQLRQQTAARLAHELMAEIIPSRYEEPWNIATLVIDDGLGGIINLDPSEKLSVPGFGLETDEDDGSTRSRFDDVDDFHGWSSSPPEDKDGTAVLNALGWTRSVTVTYANPVTLAPTAIDTGIKRVTVTVTDPRGVDTSLVALRSEASTYDAQPVDDEQYVRSIGVDLQIGADGASMVNRSAHLLNHVMIE